MFRGLIALVAFAADCLALVLFAFGIFGSSVSKPFAYNSQFTYQSAVIVVIAYSLLMGLATSQFSKWVANIIATKNFENNMNKGCNWLSGIFLVIIILVFSNVTLIEIVSHPLHGSQRNIVWWVAVLGFTTATSIGAEIGILDGDDNADGAAFWLVGVSMLLLHWVLTVAD